MNKVITANLNGNAYQLEERGYEILRAYLEAAAAKLVGNPDKDEIMSDIEQAIADKLRAVLGAYKNVVITQQVEAVIAEMGPVDTGSGVGNATEVSERGTGEGCASKDKAESEEKKFCSAKRIYRLLDGAMISGVCNGIAAYLNLDPTIIRIVFVILTAITGGAWILAYFLLVFLMPVASTDAQKSAAHGATFTAQEFIRRAKEGYYEGMKSFSDKETRRAWKRKFKDDMRAWRRSFKWEMHRGAYSWHQHWQSYWAHHPRQEAGWAIALPFLSLVRAGLAIAFLVAAISLLTNGTIWGESLPTNVPVWLGLILLFVAYKLVVWPLKAMRHVFYHHGIWGANPGPRLFMSLGESAVWLAFLGVLLWLASHHFPLVHQAIQNIPAVAHDAVNAIRNWWTER